jgi:cell division septation protein DedD
MMRHVAPTLVIALAFTGALGAQDVDLALRPPRDSIIARARAMVVDGQADAGRKLVDSVLAASAADADRYSETLFWRGVLAATAADAERSYRRLLIEAPLSERAEEALLQLAQLEGARGNRRAASDHLYRYMLSYGNSPERPARPRVSIWLVRLLFEQPDQASRGCEAVRLSRDAIPPENIELRNQLEVYVPRCAYAQAAAVAAQDTAAAEPAGDTARTAPPTDTVKASPPRDTAKAPTRPRPTASQPTKTSAPAPAGKSVYSVQVAAYDSREAAVRMAELLGTRGLDARVDGTKQPFRVRVGRFATRAEAVRLQQSLKAQGQNGFVTQVSKP